MYPEKKLLIKREFPSASVDCSPDGVLPILVGVDDGVVLGFEDIIRVIFGIELGEKELEILKAFSQSSQARENGFAFHFPFWRRNPPLPIPLHLNELVVAGLYACKEELPRNSALRLELASNELVGETYLKVIEQLEETRKGDRNE